MEWSRIKNIILLMLVLTNIILLVLVALPQAQTELSGDQARLSALSILESRGITVDSQLIPMEITHQSQIVIPDRTQESILATELLGEVSMVDLGGEVYRYEGILGSIRFHAGGEFSAQFSDIAYPLTTAEEVSEVVLDILDIDGVLSSITQEATVKTLNYRQLWDGVPLLDYDTTLLFDENHLYEITDAKRLAGTAISQDGSITVATALMQFAAGLQSLGDICRSITLITPAYSSTTDLSGTIQLTPLWCIETDTASYQLKLTTGELIRV